MGRYIISDLFIMSRKIEFKIGEYYHLYNRGVDKRQVFLDDKDYQRFLKSMKVFTHPNG